MLYFSLNFSQAVFEVFMQSSYSSILVCQYFCIADVFTSYICILMLIFYFDISVFRLPLLHKDMNGMKQLHQHRIMSVAQ